jgi:hypothetical protein
VTPFDVMLVGLGGGLGSLLRWGVGRVVSERYRGNFPLGTFLIKRQSLGGVLPSAIGGARSCARLPRGARPRTQEDRALALR